MRKICLPLQAAMWNPKEKPGDYVVLKATCAKDNDLLRRFFRTKADWEGRNGREFNVRTTFDLPYQGRTFRQNSAVWKLVTVIFENMEGRLPDEEEKYALYLDLLDVYADRVPNRVKGGLRPVHISEANSIEGSRFIDGLIHHLATECGLSCDAQATVQEIICEWESWRGGLAEDPSDYADRELTGLLGEKEWRQRHAYSQASGRGGNIVLHHIVTRGSNGAARDKAWNWLALTDEEHEALHRQGDENFLATYAHLRGKFERANKLAGLLLYGQETDGENLAAEALG